LKSLRKDIVSKNPEVVASLLKNRQAELQSIL